MSIQKRIDQLPEAIKSRIVKRSSVEEGQEKPRNFSQERFDQMPEAIKACIVKQGPTPSASQESSAASGEQVEN